jgi:hypothetical protein
MNLCDDQEHHNWISYTSNGTDSLNAALHSLYEIQCGIYSQLTSEMVIQNHQVDFSLIIFKTNTALLLAILRSSLLSVGHYLASADQHESDLLSGTWQVGTGALISEGILSSIVAV